MIRGFAELGADVLDDRTPGPADGGHAECTEHVGQQRAEQQADDDVRVREAEKSTPAPIGKNSRRSVV